jgi:hypothetical protein
MREAITEPCAEFSRPVALDTIGEGGRTCHIVASDEECAALARRFGLVAIDSLTADVTLSHISTRQGYSVVGRFCAKLTQRCVVTLRPLPVHLDETFCLRFAPADEEGSEDEGTAEVVVGLDDEDVEPLVGGKIDIGEAVAQSLAVMLDPYPRAAGAAIAGGALDNEEVNPFNVLKKLQCKE